MKNSFWGLIWSSFLEIQTFWYGFLGFAITIVFSIFAAQTTIPLVWVLVILTIALLLIATSIRALDKAFTEYQKIKQSVIPKILRIQKDTNNNIVCLLEASDLFVTEMMLSFYYTDEDGFERLIGVGFVEYIKSDGKIQAIIDQPISTYQKVLDQLVNNDLKVIQETRVKPNIPRNYNQP